jgi:serine phosphatase RsbU (regulator of sigma subunit)
MLLADGQQFRHYQRQMSRAHDLQESSLHPPAPLIEGFEVAAWALQAQELGGALFDWTTRADGSLVCVLSEVAGGGVSAALMAQTLRTALAAHLDHGVAPIELLKRVNQTLWRQSAGDQLAALCLATLQPAAGRIQCNWAGSPAVLHVAHESYQLLCEPACPLGLEPEAAFSKLDLDIRQGEALVLCTPSLARVLREPSHRLNAATLATLLIDHLDASAAHLADLVRSSCESQAIDLDQADRGVLVIKRK